MSTTISDAELDAIIASLNRAIHEIVFACHHAENDEWNDASDCLVTAQDTIDTAAQKIVAIAETP